MQSPLIQESTRRFKGSQLFMVAQKPFAKVQIFKLFECKNVTIFIKFLSIILNMCFGCSKEPSQ